MSGIESNLLKRKYVPHLPTLLAVCEVNYARLLRLLPDCDTLDLKYDFSINKHLSYSIKILDSSRYTSTLELAQCNSAVPDYMRPIMQVRLYHDAQMAEVLHSQNIGAIRPSYAYPNKKMHQKNEEEMVNRFLAEWLHFCIQQSSSMTAPEA